MAMLLEVADAVAGVVVPIAHEADFGHQDPAGGSGSGGGDASVLVIALGLIVSLLVVGALVFLKQRTGTVEPGEASPDSPSND